MEQIRIPDVFKNTNNLTNEKIMKKIILLILFFISTTLSAQINITGKITNKETGEPLPYANIQIVDTYKGTISNDEGEFAIIIRKIPSRLLIRYIGYESQTIDIQTSSRHFDISLVPKVVLLRQIVVTAEDPAVRIMRQVIEKKKQWRKRLKTYKSEAYTRAQIKNDTAIVSISESTSEVYWHSIKGSREIIKSRQETSNISSNDNFAFAGQTPNLYDDNIELMGFKIVGPTHPDALKYYNFKILDERRIDDKVIVDISIEPKNKLQPTFKGRVSIQLEDFAMLDIDVKPNQAMIFPPPIQKFNMHFRQQYSNFGKEFWLPVDVRIQGSIKIGMTGFQMPVMGYNQISRLTDYCVNIQVPDSIFSSSRTIRIDSSTVESDSLLINKSQNIPLTKEETRAYATLDSTMTLNKAFKPTGFLAKYVRVTVNNTTTENDSVDKKQGSLSKILSRIKPDLYYNRVDGLHAGAALTQNLPAKFQFTLKGAYKTGLKKSAWGAALDFRKQEKSGLSTSISWFKGSTPIQKSMNYPLIITSLDFLFGQPDYFDYYWTENLSANLGWKGKFITQIKLELGLHSENHSSLVKTTDWTLFKKTRQHRENLLIEDGRLQTITAAVTLGESFTPWGIIGINRLRLEFEHSNPDFLTSDFSYTTLRGMLDLRIPTFFKRRFLPNTLDLRLTGGLLNGHVPVQRLGSTDVRLGIFTPFGTFHTLRHHPLTGNKYLNIFWEHNFRTVPFEICGLRKIAEKGLSIIIHGASGRVENNDWYHEIGLSLSGIFSVFRLDVTKPVNKPGLYFGLSAARMF